MTTVAVLMGGWSPEREVSLVSGKACAEGLREGGHTVIEYDVKRDLRALVDFLRPAAGGGPDVVFNALHGKYGEDGCIQGVLEIMKVPYTHSGVLASAIAMDKPMSRHVFTSIGIRVALGKVVERRSLASGDPMPRPYVVKPIDQGSSVGVHIVREGDNLAAVEVAEAQFGEKVLVEKFVPGRELTVAIMGDKAVAVTELRPRTRFYDYEAKYTDGVTEHLIPAPIPAEVYEKAKEWALMAHQALGCNGARPRRPALGRQQARHRGPGRARAQHPARHDAAVAGARAGQVGRHLLARAHDLDGRPREAAGMSRATRQQSRSAGARATTTAASEGREPDPQDRPADLAPADDAGPWPCCMLGLGGGGGWWAWKQGWLVAAQEQARCRRHASVIAAVTPFKLTDVTVEGRDYVTREAILAALNVQAGDSLLGIDLQAARKRLEAIDWVASATVERRLPDTLYVTLKERRAVAIWQNGNEYTLIDKNGRTVRASRMPPGAESLLLLGGPGAPEHVGELLLLLAYEPSIAKQLRAAVWVGQRRWNLVLNNDAEIWLPEEDAVAALQRSPNSKRRINCCRASSASSICGCRTSSISGSAAPAGDPPPNGPVVEYVET